MSEGHHFFNQMDVPRHEPYLGVNAGHQVEVEHHLLWGHLEVLHGLVVCLLSIEVCQKGLAHDVLAK